LKSPRELLHAVAHAAERQDIISNGMNTYKKENTLYENEGDHQYRGPSFYSQ